MEVALPSSRRRLFAYIIDRMILGLAVVPWLTLSHVLDTDAGELHISWGLGALLITVPFTYRVMFLMWNGQTPGKLIMRLQIVSAESLGPLSLPQACIRSLCEYFQFFSGYLFESIALFRRDRRQLADLCAETRVIQLTPSGEPQGLRPFWGVVLLVLSISTATEQFYYFHNNLQVTSRGVILQLETSSADLFRLPRFKRGHTF